MDEYFNYDSSKQFISVDEMVSRSHASAIKHLLKEVEDLKARIEKLEGVKK